MRINSTFHVKSMINDAMACKIKRLHKEGLPKAEIAGLVGCSRQTVYAYLKDPLRGLRPEMLQRPKPFKLDAGNQAKIEALFKASPSNCAVVTQRINADPVGYGLPADTTVSRRSVERYGKARFPGLFAKSAMLPVQPFHCEKGEQLQIDFVQAKFRYGGSGSTDAPSTVYIFEACYAWSRKSFVWVCPDMTQASWLLGIAKCLAALGIPRTILCDNDKGLVIRNDWQHKRIQYNPAFDWLCRPLGIRPKAARPSRPQTKGRIERFGRYLQENGLIDVSVGSNIRNASELQAALDRWIKNVADKRCYQVNGNLCTVEELYAQEREHLTFAGDLGVNFDVTTWTTEVSSSSVIHVYGTKVQLGRQQANTRVCVAMRLNGEFIVTSGDGRVLVQDSVPIENLQNFTRDQGANPAAQIQQAQPRPRHMSSAMADLDVLYQE